MYFDNWLIICKKCIFFCVELLLFILIFWFIWYVKLFFFFKLMFMRWLFWGVFFLRVKNIVKEIIIFRRRVIVKVFIIWSLVLWEFLVSLELLNFIFVFGFLLFVIVVLVFLISVRMNWGMVLRDVIFKWIFVYWIVWCFDVNWCGFEVW